MYVYLRTVLCHEKSGSELLIVLVARLALGCMTGGLTQYLYIGLLVNPLGNVCLSIGVMHLAGVGFYDRIQGEAM